MGYHVKELLPCVECATPTTKRLDGSRAPLCLQCGIRRAIKWLQLMQDLKTERIERDRLLAVSQQRQRDRAARTSAGA